MRHQTRAMRCAVVHTNNVARDAYSYERHGQRTTTMHERENRHGQRGRCRGPMDTYLRHWGWEDSRGVISACGCFPRSSILEHPRHRCCQLLGSWQLYCLPHGCHTGFFTVHCAPPLHACCGSSSSCSCLLASYPERPSIPDPPSHPSLCTSSSGAAIVASSVHQRPPRDPGCVSMVVSISVEITVPN